MAHQRRINFVHSVSYGSRLHDHLRAGVDVAELVWQLVHSSGC